MVTYSLLIIMLYKLPQLVRINFKKLSLISLFLDYAYIGKKKKIQTGSK